MLTSAVRRWLSSGRIVSLAMLVTLHLALWFGVQSVWSRPFLFAHLGLFLMWQPLWRGEEKLSTGSAVIIVGMSVLGLLWLNWWLLAIWVSSLFALVGGRVFAFQSFWQRLRYLLVMGYLLAVLLFWVTPRLFLLPITGEAGRDLMLYVLPLVLAGMSFIPEESERLKKTEVFDLIYSLLLFMLLTMLVLGSLTFMSLGRVDYFQSLLRTLFMMALVLFALGWLWNPRLGFAGFQTVFSRYFLNIGTPFELWVKRLAIAAQQETPPEVFLQNATAQLAELPWISGLHWSCAEAEGQHGEKGRFDFTWAEHDLYLMLYARQRLTPAVMMHVHLLCQILAHFFHAKKSEQRLRELLRLQAVHETGARVTHDLKNMLQSLLVLIDVVEKQPGQAQAIVLSQLPVIANRIELALSKLKLPRHASDTAMMPLANWWASLQERQQFRNVEWVYAADGQEPAVEIPGALFDNVADNLIENARNKRSREPHLEIRIHLQASPLRLTVCDDGSAIPEQVARQLLSTVVDSEDGLGVGLFQAARWAEKSGFQLRLLENRGGRVCFALSMKK